MDISTKFDGLKLENPLMPAAGPLVGDAEKMLWSAVSSLKIMFLSIFTSYGLFGH